MRYRELDSQQPADQPAETIERYERGNVFIYGIGVCRFLSELCIMSPEL